MTPIQQQATHASPPQAQYNSQTKNNVALGLIGGTFVGIMAFTTPFVAMQLRSALPYMATPRRKVEKALKFASLRLASHEKSNGRSMRTQQNAISVGKWNTLNFVDLGSGDGTTILAAASLGWNATGLELNPTLWFISSMRRLFLPRTVRSKSQLVMGDMFENPIARERLRSADCVMIFGVKSLMPNIADLVQRECRPGCLLMSYRFRVPLLMSEHNTCARKSDSNANDRKKPSANASSGVVNATLIYGEEEMHIYELDGFDGRGDDKLER